MGLQHARRRLTNQASAALKGAAERTDPEKVNANSTVEIGATPFNVRLRALVGRLFAASVGGTSRQTSGESVFRLRTKVMKKILAPQTESQNSGTKYTAESGADVAPMLDGHVS